ncbi:hypothetical protein J3R83DRAFT_3396 [Lanmaoa asiatica]|nr:hypothetical protein J3R83DRAFT_3396 [Lanmaoa asiatica]
MTTWAQPIRHPWFNSPTMKRRLSANDDGDDDSSDLSSSTFSASRRKRVKYNSLERTLAHMTLGSALATGTSEDVDMWPKTPPPRPRVQETLNIILPSMVEEPDTPASEPFDMEVEPFLVTAGTLSTTTPLPRAIDDESTGSEQLDIREVQISSAVLECLRRQTNCPPPLIPLASQTSQALVLYRAPRPPSPRPLEPACDHEEGKSTWTSILVAHEDDVMEVE